MPALSAEQRAAIEMRSGPLQLAAAAGAGKTAVLVERFAMAVLEDGLPVSRILAITFTERAASELRERLRARLQDLGQPLAAHESEAALIGTFHGLCARMLRAHALAAGVDPAFTILDEPLAAELRGLAFRQALPDVLAQGADAVDLLAAQGTDGVRAMTFGAYAELRSRGEREPRLPEARDPGADPLGARALALLDLLLAGFGRRYGELKRARQALDFDDLELLAVQVLAGETEVRRYWSERLALVMVDEFQDTNRRQLRLLELLDPEKLFTVGDELQSIYGFRHAEVEIFRARREQLARRSRSLELSLNFRSRPAIIAAVAAVFGERFGPQRVLPRATREPAPAEGPALELLLSARKGWDGEGVSERVAGALPVAPAWRQAEARLIAQRVAELIAAGSVRGGEVVLLFRALTDVHVYEAALHERGLSTLASAGSFWSRQAVIDLLAYLRALANPLDELALYGMLASPLAGLSADALVLIARAAKASRASPWAALGAPEARERLAAADREALTRLLAWMPAQRRAATRLGPAELIERGVLASGYDLYLRGLRWPERELANIGKLARLARRFEREVGTHLRPFIDHAETQRERDAAAEPPAPVADLEPDAVRLMSIHAAKGLEFEVVCLADLGRAPVTRLPDLLVDGERVGIKLSALDGSDPEPLLDYAELAEERKAAEAQEEERILYVAMTRARERLIVSGALDFERGLPAANGGPGPTIDWLAPALAADLGRLLALPDGPAVRELSLEGHPDVAVRCVLSSPETLGEALREDSLAGCSRAPALDAAPVALPLPLAYVAPAPPAGEDPDAALSYTSLSERERCRDRYTHVRVLGIPGQAPRDRRPDGARELAGDERGRLVHGLLEGHVPGRSQPPREQEIAERARALELRLGAPERRRLGVTLAALWETPLAGRVARAGRVRTEDPFALALAGQLLTGVLDLWAQEGAGRALILDYKSDRIAEGDDLESLLERAYGLQRELYALAGLRAGAATVEVVYWFLDRPGAPVGASYRAADRAQLEGRLARRVGAVLERPFAVSATPHRGLCRGCPGLRGLCSWSPAQTGAPAGRGPLDH